MWSPAGALQTAAPQRLQSSAHLFSTWCEMWMKLAAQRVRVFPKSQVSFLEVLDLPALLHRFRAHVCVILSSLHSFVFSCTQRHLINNVLFTRRIRFSPNHFFSCFNQQYYISTSTPFSSFSLYPVQLSSSSLASSHLSWGLRLQHLISISVSGQPGGFERGGFVKPNACVFVCFLIHLSLCLLCLHMCVGIHTCVCGYSFLHLPSSAPYFYVFALSSFKTISILCSFPPWVVYVIISSYLFFCHTQLHSGESSVDVIISSNGSEV